MKRIIFLLGFTTFTTANVFSQSVGVGTATPDASAMFQVDAINKGVLVPRLTNVQMNAIPGPARGLMIFNTDYNRFFYFDGSVWKTILNNDDNADNLHEIVGNDSLTSHNIILGDTTTQWTVYRDAISQFKRFQNTTGLSGTLLQSLRTEKYGMDYTPYGRVGSWNRYLTRNWYNANGRPGEILTRESYNTTAGGDAIFPGEGAWSHVLESEWNRQFEDYVQITLSTGYSYRPFAMYIDKDIPENDITFKGSLFHVNPVEVAEDFLSVKNGKMVLNKVQSAPSIVTNTLFSIKNGTREINLINNTQALVLTGAYNYVFDNVINPITSHTINLGINTSRWKNVFTDAIVASYITVADANYLLSETDHTINFKNITQNRSLVLSSAFSGRRLELISGQNSYTVVFSGIAVRNSDGTTAAALPPGKSCVLSFDGTTWWVVAVGAVL